MSNATVTTSVHGAVREIRLNRPKAMNTFDDQLRRELPAALGAAVADDSVRVIVLTAEGRAFGAGADLKEGIPKNVDEQLRDEYWPIFDAIIASPKPVISAVRGATAGISLSVALIADLCVMADDAFFLSPFSTIGLVPDGGACHMLVRQLGLKRAYQLAVENERIDAARALDWGLVNRVVPVSELDANALEWAQSLAARAPLALAETKQLMRLGQESDFRSVYLAEAEAQLRMVNSADAEEGMAAFLAKRQAQFHGR